MSLLTLCDLLCRSRHPGLIEYINTVLDGARTLISADGISKVVLCVLDRDGVVVERYCFAVGRPTESKEDDGVQDTEYLFRALLMRLHLINGTLPPPPPNATFNILLYSSTEDDAMVRSFVDSPESGWVDVSDERLSREKRSDGASLLVVPGKEVVTPLVSFQFDVYLNSNTTTTAKAPHLQQSSSS